jgi:DNA-directed RNA polymerase specialized sigma24 family protein
MGVSPNTVNNHIVRAMDALRDRLRDYRPDLLS